MYSNNALKKMVYLTFNLHSKTLITILLFLFVSVGCSTPKRYVPDPTSAKNSAGHFVINTTVDVINAQASTKVHKLDFNNLEVTYKDYTQALVDALESELVRSGAGLSRSAEKILKVAVKEVYLTGTANTYVGYMLVEVEMGNGKIESFESSRQSLRSGFNIGLFPTKPLDVAFVDLVASIFENKNIKFYLSN